MRTTHTFSKSSGFAQAVGRAAAPKVNRLLQQTADEAAKRADAIVAKEFDNARPTGRRRKGHRHLAGSFKGTVKPVSGLNDLGAIELRSSAPSAKVGALNYGSPAHQIGADGRTLAFPASSLGGQYKKSASYFKKRQAGDRGRNVVVKGPVNHPGTVGTHFLERALEQAVRARLRAPVTIPRR